MAKVIVPELGEGIKNATVVMWHVKLGARVSADDDLVELVTDKATFNVPAGQDGIVRKILVKEGQVVDVGSVLAEIVPIK